MRRSSREDLEEILEIYNHAVRALTATFDIRPRSLKEWRRWFLDHNSRHPLITAELDGKVVGYCSILPFSRKEGYARTVELSIYVHRMFWRKGIGKTLMAEAIRRARELGYHAIISIIAQNNEPSVRLHETFEFQKVAHLKQVGYKFRTWLDVVYYELLL